MGHFQYAIFEKFSSFDSNYTQRSDLDNYVADALPVTTSLPIITLRWIERLEEEENGC